MFNTNDRQRQREAAKQHALKLAFELTLIKAVRPVFRKVSRDFREQFGALGIMPSLDTFSKEMHSTLQTHYDKVADTFSTRIVDKLGKPITHDAVVNSIESRTALHHQIRADESAQAIVNTTRKDMIQSVQQASQEALQRGEQAISSEIAGAARLKLDQKNAARMQTIAMTETQNPAEHAKQAEIDFLDWHDVTLNGQRLRERKKFKKWEAILDTRTRHSHVEADNQVVPFDGFYTVQGQKLRFPGDMSLGATLDNVINCRCSSIIIIR